MTPGQYLAALRRNAGISIDQLAGWTRTVPYATPEHETRALLARIEADDAPITEDVSEVYQRTVRADLTQLRRLILVHAGLALREPATLDLTPEQQLPPPSEKAA